MVGDRQRSRLGLGEHRKVIGQGVCRLARRGRHQLLNLMLIEASRELCPRDLLIQVSRQRQLHIFKCRHAVGWPPRFRCHAHQGEFDRQRPCARLQIRIDARRICLEELPRFGIQLGDGLFGEAIKTQRADERVGRNAGRSHHFGKATLHHAADELHLPKPVLRRRVTQAE